MDDHKTNNQIRSIRGLIVDMDGVLWRGPEPVVDLPALFALIRKLGLKIVLATNNATRSPDQYIERLRSYGVDLETWQVVNSAQAAAAYLKRRFPGGGKVYIIGEDGLELAMAEQGFASGDGEVDAVVVGMDRNLTYEKLRRAALLIRAGTPFVATNPDLTFPTPEGEVPGAGAIVAAVQVSTNVIPVVAGKPSPEMYRVALERLGTTPTETLVIGDRLETDIAGAQALGCRTGLVLSGVTTPEEAQAWTPLPDVVAKNIRELIEGLETGDKLSRT